ncbi:sulfotransferase family 2 domain-containing protein [Neptunicella marina]|uniref:Sulfotransferase family 2 domain-containing protein n=1 Tax=Neptunicella marina TaxID=2125989 RepID=A0A8J6IMB7_9ALTE|nr:sulfotransferase family 2 domain-containing protein [Neptunicella marina]MBC3764920.1 sulfotransferase family 2 domain-containing protein [Neptunicella marina]
MIQNKSVSLFVHIPKTAGTSLREALVEVYGEKNFVSDYGPQEKITNQLVLNNYYNQKDMYQFIDAGVEAIYGHFSVSRYLNLSNCLNLITFVRNPLERIVSEYKHVRRYSGFEGSFDEFISMPRMVNSQSQFLNGVPWSAIGFVGVAEHYEKSIELLESRLNKGKLRHKKVNTASKRDLFVPTESDVQSVIKLNQKDIELYNKLLEKFMWREKISLFSGQPFMHGSWEVNPKRNVINGFAFYENSDEPVMLDMIINGEKVSTLVANGFHAPLRKLGVNRLGYVGFRYSIKTNPYDKIELINNHTKQPLPMY